MALIYGLIFLALAISLAVFWWTVAFIAALQVLLVTALGLAGFIMTLVGYSAIKATREFNEAVGGDSPRSDSAPED